MCWLLPHTPRSCRPMSQRRTQALRGDMTLESRVTPKPSTAVRPRHWATCRDRLLETRAVPEPQGRRLAADAEQRLRPAGLPTRGGRLGSARPPSRGGGQGGSWVFGGVGRQGQQGGGREGATQSRVQALAPAEGQGADLDGWTRYSSPPALPRHLSPVAV